MSPRNKKKPARKPKANAVKSKRRPHRPAALRPPGDPHDRAEKPNPQFEQMAERTAGQTVASTPDQTDQPTEEQTDERALGPLSEPTTEPKTRWAADDPNALWWDEVWPFKDETHGRSSLAETSTGIVEPDVEPDEEPAVEVPPPLSVPPASPSQSFVLMCVLVTLIAAGGLVWWATGRGPDEHPIATHSHSYAVPVRLAPDSSFIRSRVLRSGDLLVTHWIHTSHRVDAVTLQAPRVPGLSPHALSISDLVVAGDGTRMPSSAVRSVGPTTLALLPSNWLYVHYRLSGVVQASGGPSERALARITAIDVSTSSPVRTTLTVVGAEVLALACTPVGQDVAVPCGRDFGAAWSARLGRGQQGSQVMAQLNLS